MTIDVQTLKYDEQGLVVGVVQTPMGEVRMVGMLNRTAIEQSLRTGYVTFWSRSRNALWTKGETSGNRLRLVAMQRDCDGDALLIVAEPEGPTCHLGNETCFNPPPQCSALLPWFAQLEQMLRARKVSPPVEGSYTQSLFLQGNDRIAKKVVEEAGEVVLAAKNLQFDPSSREAFLGEAADLLFHLELLLVHHDVSFADVVGLLKQRHDQMPTRGPQEK